MTDKERTFGVVSKRGSAQFTGTVTQVTDDILAFLADIEERSVGVVPANAKPKDDISDRPAGTSRPVQG